MTEAEYIKVMEIKNVFRLAGTSVMKILELQIKKILKDYKGKKKGI